MYPTGSNEYQSRSVETANPAQLVLMLYDRILVGILRARQSEERQVVNHELQRVQQILSELTITLDHERGGEIAANLHALYGFCRDRVIKANVTQDLHLLEDVDAVVRDLRNAWEEGCVNSPQPVGSR